jgi:hypothetical protein
MGNSNQRKDATLGMAHGTANGRLRKNILFFLLRKHNENICVRCDLSIETVEELSIEHIKPWEGISAELFWDLQNIAFSHLRCNIPHRYGPGPVARVVPDGMAWCTGHKIFESIDNFWKDSSTYSGFQKYCKQSRLPR